MQPDQAVLADGSGEGKNDHDLSSPLGIAGHLDGIVEGLMICGWAYSEASDGAPLHIEVMETGNVLLTGTAGHSRPDVAEAGAGGERCGPDDR